jgi:hypothetical protein
LVLGAEPWFAFAAAPDQLLDPRLRPTEQHSDLVAH